MKWTTEAKVGAFTIVGIIAFIAAVLFVGNVSIFPKAQMVVTGQFDTAGGLKAGNTVKYSGVDIGTVDAIDVNTHSVTVRMKMDPSKKIPKDSTFSISSDGLLGDKYVQITPGESNEYLQDGDYVTGQGAGPMDQAFNSAQKLMEGTGKLLESMNHIIGDAQTQEALRHTLRSTSTMADNTVEITGNLASLTAQMNATAQQFNADGNAGSDMRQILTNIKDTTDKVDSMARSMEGTVTDPQAQDNIKETLHNTAQISARVNKLLGGKAYQSGAQEGTIAGEAMTDSEKKSKIRTETSADLLYNSSQDEYRANARLRLFTNKNLMELGFSNIGDGTDLDLNGGKYIADNWTARAGFFEGELGVGLDYGLGGPFSLSAAMYDLNHRKYRIRSEFRLFKDTYGVAQLTRPFSSRTGGTYFGIKQTF